MFQAAFGEERIETTTFQVNFCFHITAGFDMTAKERAVYSTSGLLLFQILPLHSHNFIHTLRVAVTAELGGEPGLDDLLR